MDDFLKTYLVTFAPKVREAVGVPAKPAPPAEPAPKAEKGPSPKTVTKKRKPAGNMGDLRSTLPYQWKALSAWLAETGGYAVKDRTIPYSMGKYLQNSWAPSAKMIKAANRIWDKAVQDGWEPEAAPLFGRSAK